jgi:amino acid adenylation domain-containing protein/thioester reductase-like protein
VNQPEGAARDDFVVVVNDLDQHALWPASLETPKGWRRKTGAMTRSECLSAIEASWADVTPASVRAAVPTQRRPPRAAQVRPGSAGAADTRQPRFAHERFAEQAARRPGAVAVSTTRGQLTYGELDESANRLAHYLRDVGAAPEALIGVYLDRGIDMIRAILAIMKAGAAYLPLDPALPTDRLDMICSQLRPVAVLADRTDTLDCTGTRLIPIGEVADLASRPATAPETRPHPDNLCYAIYTSGSTGDPKAVGVSYHSLARVISDVVSEYQVGPDDRVGQVASIAFDTSLEQMFVPLTSGAALVLPPPGTLAPSDLLRGIGRRRVTVIDLTPAYWHQLLALTTPSDERLSTIRLMITGGELAALADCRAALRTAPQARLLNAYGLTETAITSNVHDVGSWLAEGNSAETVPVGRPVGHARIMVLDEQLNPVASGTPGEIYIGGEGVARGYLGRPGLTAERFLPDPGGVPGGRMYRTGDLGHIREDGSLEVAGRVDRQLKVRGYRIEPAEIESVLAGHPDVGQSIVVATRGRSGDTRLVAYYTPRQAAAGAAYPPSASLRRYLLDRLPAYMVPASFIARHHLPPRSGPDARPEASQPRDRLEPERDGRQTSPSRAADGTRYTPMQAGLSALWGRMLHREHVGLDDDFFAIGGNSLLAAEMLAHTRAMFGIPADSARRLTRCLLREPTLRAFAAAITDARAGKLSPDNDQADIDFAAEAALNVKVNANRAASLPRPGRPGVHEILLTGATGFLGAHLLSELLSATSARVCCLVRARDEANALDRITRAAAAYELPAPSADRVVALPGDLAEPRLGLGDAKFRDLARRIDVIYHAGALVNFIYPYSELRAANVAGTREVIRLAGEYRGIPVHYVSSTAVLAGLGVAGVRKVTERTPLAHPELLRMGYVETKYVAEELLRNASGAGLPMAVYRPLDIVGSVGSGAWSTSTEMCALIRFITDTGLAPDIDLPLDFVAADTCAAAIRHISLSAGGTGLTYHLASSGQAPLGVLVDRLRQRGYPITAVPYSDWVSELAQQAARDPSHPMAAFLPLFVDRDDASGLTVAEMYLSNVFPAYGRSNTERALRGSGIEFPPVSGPLLDRNIDRLMATGYLSAPSARRRPVHAG